MGTGGALTRPLGDKMSRLVLSGGPSTRLNLRHGGRRLTLNGGPSDRLTLQSMGPSLEATALLSWSMRFAGLTWQVLASEFNYVDSYRFKWEYVSGPTPGDVITAFAPESVNYIESGSGMVVGNTYLAWWQTDSMAAGQWKEVYYDGGGQLSWLQPGKNSPILPEHGDE